MSVIKSKRTTSDMEFLVTARNLQIYTIQKCVNFPKRYTFFVPQPLANATVRVYEDVKRANSIYPINQHEVQIQNGAVSYVRRVRYLAELAKLRLKV